MTVVFLPLFIMCTRQFNGDMYLTSSLGGDSHLLILYSVA